MMFKIGDKVYLREDSVWNDSSENNPLNMVGVVEDIHPELIEEDDLPINVRWQNGDINTYNCWDLVPEEEYLCSRTPTSQSVVNRFDLEQRIMECWAVVDDIKTLYELLDMREVSENEMQNYLLGLQTIYQVKFELLWETFEQMIKGE